MQIEENRFDSFSRDALSIRTDTSIETEMYQSVQRSLHNIIAKEGYVSHKIFSRSISTEGGNYLGKLYEVDIEGETIHGNKEINIFVKHIIPGKAVKELIDMDTGYKNEVFVYLQLGKIFNTLQESAQIPEEEKFKLVKSYEETSTDAIILDNMRKKGYQSLYRMDVIPLKFAELSIKQLAKFHALSFVLKHKRREYFEEKIKTVKTPLQFNESWKGFVKRLIDYSIKYFDKDVQKKLDKFKYVLWEKQPKYVTGDTESTRCLCHGDFRMNNLLFKNNEDKTEVSIIDYQLIFYGSPVIDIIYLLYTSTDREFRKAHTKNLKNLYHNTLTYFLDYFDLDVNNVYPRKLLDKEFKDCLDYGLMTGLFLLPFCFAVEDEVPDFEKNTVEDMTFKLDDRFKMRITEIVEEYLDLGIL